MKRLIRPLIIAFFFTLSVFHSSYSQSVNFSQTELNLSVLNSLKNKNLVKPRKEILSLLEFVIKSKQSGREIDNGKFLLNDSEIDCHGNITSNSKYCGLVSFETRSNSDFILHGFNSVFGKKDDLTIIFSKSETLNETTISLFTETSKIEIRLDEKGAGSFKEMINGEFSNSVSWMENGTGKWAKVNKAGKFSTGNFGADTELAFQ